MRRKGKGQFSVRVGLQLAVYRDPEASGVRRRPCYSKISATNKTLTQEFPIAHCPLPILSSWIFSPPKILPSSYF